MKVLTVTASIVLLISVGCASPSSTLSEAIVSPRSIEEASEVLQGDCYDAEGDSLGEFLHPSRILDAADVWIEVSSVEFGSERPPLFERGVTMFISGSVDIGKLDGVEHSSGQVEALRLDTDELTRTVIDWALQEGHQVHVAAHGNVHQSGLRYLNSASFVEVRDVGPVFVGECGGLSLDRPMRATFGDNFAQSVRLLTTTPDAVEQLYPPHSDRD